MYDVLFILVWFCFDGFYLFFFDYIYECIKVDEIVYVSYWSGFYCEFNGINGG